MIDLWKEALENQKEANNALKESKDRIKDYNDQLNVLRSRKKNINIAVNLINKSLRYVFSQKIDWKSKFKLKNMCFTHMENL